MTYLSEHLSAGFMQPGPGSYRYGQPSWFLMYRGGGVFLAVGLGLDTNIRIFLTIFRRFSDIVRGGRKIASSIGKMFQMCMFACFIWNNVPVNCIIQNHCFEIGYADVSGMFFI